MRQSSWQPWLVDIWTLLRRPRRRRGRRSDKHRTSGRLLRGEWLEQRRLLATFTDTGTALNLALDSDQQVDIIGTGSTYTLTLSSGAWSGTETADVTGNTLSTLTVTPTGLITFASGGINITDSGNPGDSVVFADSEASAYFDPFTVTLNGASSPSLSFAGSTTFTSTASLTATVNGAVSINAGATINMFEGSLALASAGTDTALTDSGNIVTQGGAVSLSATGNVTVSPDVTIQDNGSAPLTLVADVTASGTGDDGTGTLSIDAGATVATTGVITLRGADMDIDTSSNPAVVGASRSLGATPSASYSSGISDPEALAFDSSGNLYVLNFGNNTVEKFAPGSATPSATYSNGISAPLALAIDSSGNLYVSNYDGNTVEEFAPGSTTPSATYSNGINFPLALAFDSSGNLYVANIGNDTVEKFAPGSTTPSATYSDGIDDPRALAFDTSGNLYVANGDSSTVEMFAPGSTTASATYSNGIDDPQALAFDSSGNLYVVNILGNTVEMFAPGSTTPSVTYSAGLDAPLPLAFDAAGNLYVANRGNNTVETFAPGSTTPSATYSNGIDDPQALAFDSSGNLYVANYAGGFGTTVSKFSPASVTPTADQVFIQSSVESRPMLIGGTNASPVVGINLSSAELAQIYTTSTGSVTIGDSQQTGAITFNAATPITTAGASLNVVQNAAGSGQVILDDGAGTALSGNGSGAITLTAGTGGIVAANPNDTTAEISASGPTVTLLTAGPIGSSTGRIQFADNASTAEQVVEIGSTTIQPSSVYLDGLGSLTLGNIIAYGTNPTVDVTARTNLVVLASATINSGSGPIMLGADLTAAETGDDGVGTLSIDAGATVVTSGAITLRGADMNIDASSNPAVVGGTRVLATTASATYSNGINFLSALAIDSSGNLYVANQGGSNTVEKFAPGSTTASATYSNGISAPLALAIDSSGNLYVANQGGNTVEMFAPGSTTASATYSSGVDIPDALAFDSSGNLYVANLGGNTVEKFAPGSTTASAIYSNGISAPSALAIDSSGNLYVANLGGNTVEKFAPGSTTASATYSNGISHPEALAFDSIGNLYVANFGNVEKFAPGSTTASATYSNGISFSLALAIDSSGNLYVANRGNNTVEKFAPGSTTASATYSSGVDIPVALAFDSSGNLYVANNGNSTVEEFSPATVTPTAASITIRSSVESRPMSIGAGNAVAGINLTSAELAQIFTTGTGTLTLGDTQQTGNITFTTATPVTTSGAALDVVQSAGGAGTIVLSEGSDVGVGLFNSGGSVSLSPGTGGVQTTPLSNFATPLVAAGVTIAGGPLNLTLSAAPAIGEQFTILGNTTTPAATNPVSGTFSNLPQGGVLTTSFDSNSYSFLANYEGGDGNDLVLTNFAVATQLVVTSGPPSSVTAGSPFALTVMAEDGQGDVDTDFDGDVTLALANNPGASTLGGTVTVMASDGIAVFSDLTLNKADAGYTLQASSGTLASATSSAISVTPGTATQLLITPAPPAAVAVGGNFDFTVAAEDAEGNVATGFSGSETVTLVNNPGGSTLAGPLTATATGGIATFTGLSLNKAGNGYQLFVTSSAIPNMFQSISLDVTTTADLTISTQPTTGVSIVGGVFSATGAAPNINITDLHTALVNNPNVTITNAGLPGDSDNIEWLAGADLDSSGIPAGRTLAIVTAPTATAGNLSIASTVNLPGDILLAGQSVTLSGSVDAGGTLWIKSAGGVSQSAPLEATNLSVSAAGNVSLTAMNDVGGELAIHDAALGAFVEWLDTAGFQVGSIAAATAAEDSQGIFGAVAGVSTSGNFIALENTSGSMLLGDGQAGEGVTATGGDVRLESAGAITQNSAGGGAITAGALGIVAGGNVELSQSVNTAILVSIDDSSGYVRFVDSSGFAVGTVGGVSPAIFSNAVHGVTTVGSDIALQNNTGSLQLGNGNASEVVSATGAGGDVRLDSAGAIVQNPSAGGAITAGALGIVADGNVDLSQSVNTAVLVAINNSLGYVRFVDSSGFAVGTVGGVSSKIIPSAMHGVTTVGGDIALQNNAGSLQLGNGAASEIISATGAGGDVRLDSAGGIAQDSTAGGAITAGALGVLAHGNVDLTQTPNTAVLVAISDSSGYVRFVDSSGFIAGTVGAVNGKVFTTAVHGVVTTGGDIALQNNSGNMQLGNGAASEIVSATGAGGDVRLESAGAIVQAVSGGAITAGALGIVAAGPVTLNLATNVVSAILAIDDTAAGTVSFSDNVPFAQGTVGAVSPKIFPHAITGVTTVTPNPTL